MLTGDAYSVVAEATDSLGNVGSSSTVTFTYCLKASPPSVAITYPIGGTTYGSNWSKDITGSASAATGATLTSVSVAIEDTKSKSWWNGSAFSVSSQTCITVTGTSTWYSPPVSLTSGHSYAAIAEAKDNLGNTATSSTVDFSYLVKTPPPTVTITYPVSGTTYGTNWTGTFTGTASAGTGATISKTLLSIEDTTTKLWWNGSAFSASSQTWITVTGTTTWMYTPSAGLTSGKSLCRHG